MPVQKPSPLLIYTFNTTIQVVELYFNMAAVIHSYRLLFIKLLSSYNFANLLSLIIMFHCHT